MVSGKSHKQGGVFHRSKLNPNKRRKNSSKKSIQKGIPKRKIGHSLEAMKKMEKDTLIFAVRTAEKLPVRTGPSPK